MKCAMIADIQRSRERPTVLCLSDAGVAYALPAYKVPATSRTSRGVLAHQLLPINENERIATVLPVSDFSTSVFLVLLTKRCVPRGIAAGFQFAPPRGAFRPKWHCVHCLSRKPPHASFSEGCCSYRCHAAAMPLCRCC